MRSTGVTAVILATIGLLAALGVAQEELPAGKLASPAAVEFFPKPTAAEQKILDALDKVGDLKLEAAGLGEAVEFLRTSHGINVVVDPRALPAMELEQLKLSLDVQQVKLRSALNLLCKPNGLAWMMDDEVIKITAPAAADTIFITRTYPVADLCPGPDDLKGLRVAVEKSSTPVAWDSQGGTASIADVGAAHSLVITQTWHGHQHVLNLLRMLRQAKGFATPDPAAERK